VVNLVQQILQKPRTIWVLGKLYPILNLSILLCSISILYMLTMCLIKWFFWMLINIRSYGVIRQSKKLIYFRVIDLSLLGSWFLKVIFWILKFLLIYLVCRNILWWYGSISHLLRYSWLLINWFDFLWYLSNTVLLFFSMWNNNTIIQTKGYCYFY
jgi:hypothetical protein